MQLRLSLLLAALLGAASATAQDREIRLPRHPRILPDGERVVFAWQGDVWIAPLRPRAEARRLTVHAADDEAPLPSPDGEQVLFESDRSGNGQLWVVPVAGGKPRQVTFDSEGKTALQWMADGQAVLAIRRSNHSPFSTEARRLVRLPLERPNPERVLFDAGANYGRIGPDGRHVLFTRGRISEVRKGYRGPAAEQIWIADLEADGGPELTRSSQDRENFQNVSERTPLWAPDGGSFFFVSDPDGCFDVYRRDVAGGETTRVTDLQKLDGSDDGAMEPSLSKDGRKLLFRRRFDLMVLDVPSGELTSIGLFASGDAVASSVERRRLSNAGEVAFTKDGEQIAFVSGHDLYVMDRILREPKQVTSTLAVEDTPVFAEGGKRLFFVSEAGGEVDIWEATCGRDDDVWWLSEEFALRRVTDDAAVEGRLLPSPGGEHIAYVKDNSLWVMDQDGSDHRRIYESWDSPSADWSPDGKWLCWSVEDGNFNDEVWVAPIDGSREPYNISRHPDDDRGPAWSRDGKRIAWVGRRDGQEWDIYYVELTKEVAEETERDRKLREALKKLKKGKKKQSKEDEPNKDEPKKDEPKQDEPESGEEAAGDAEKGAKQADDDAGKDEDAVEIDFDGIHDRVQRIRITDSYEGSLLWSPDGSKLYFRASPDGNRGIYRVEFPDELRPKRVASSLPAYARWLKQGNQIVGLSGGNPATMNPGNGKTETFGFRIQEQFDWSALRQLAFDQGWRAMRDRFYDGNHNNRDWTAIRAKYRPVAAQCIGREEFSLLMNLMLGELNASHMGHGGGRDPLPSADRPDWTPTTWELGLRFDRDTEGPGLLVDSVIPESPCAQERSLVRAGERVLAIDGTDVGPDTDLVTLLTLDEQQPELTLKVRGAEGAERDVVVRPTRSVRGLLYEEWVENARQRVEELSDGRLGYLHIRGMNMGSFRQMEEDIYHAGYGKEGLIIDVRFNGGGSTADHVLTALTQPRHAITRPRGGPQGYPQDRKIYASWDKPIVLMCNELSFSNAEILSHAIKTLGRGPVVGMRTAGGVISTGGHRLVDGGYVRMPFRGWYVYADGQDMELNGCMPDHALWNEPDGPDAQLAKAVEVLQGEVEAAPEPPELIKASEREGR